MSHWESQLAKSLETEADNYYFRNSSKSATDPVLEVLRGIHATAPIQRCLELGAFDGRRLAAAAAEFGCDCTGIEASHAAVRSARVKYPQIDIRQGAVPWALERYPDHSPFDVVVIGFMLYLLPRPLLFRTAALVDQLVATGGHLVVYDFLSEAPTRHHNRHTEDLEVFKMDYSRAWTWHPQYTLVKRVVSGHGAEGSIWPATRGDWVTVDVIHKSDWEEAFLLDLNA